MMPKRDNAHSANIERLTETQQLMLTGMSDKEPLLFLSMDADKLFDLCWLVHYSFVVFEEKEGQLICKITLPGMYARGVLLARKKAA